MHLRVHGFTGLVGKLFVDKVTGHDVFDTDHQAGFAGDRGTVRKPAGTAAHRFGQKVGSGRFGIVNQVANFGGQKIDGGEKAKRKINAVIIVVNCLGQMDNGITFSVAPGCC